MFSDVNPGMGLMEYSVANLSDDNHLAEWAELLSYLLAILGFTRKDIFSREWFELVLDCPTHVNHTLLFLVCYFERKSFWAISCSSIGTQKSIFVPPCHQKSINEDT